ncbi:hypothetical protein G6F63_016476 [Rhizopus arrhizus]|nr:hypothetical protein G6F63_016476 [Rhizopus arrhizus]
MAAWSWCWGPRACVFRSSTGMAIPSPSRRPAKRTWSTRWRPSSSRRIRARLAASTSSSTTTTAWGAGPESSRGPACRPVKSGRRRAASATGHGIARCRAARIPSSVPCP